jgi:hypothetical protein
MTKNDMPQAKKPSAKTKHALRPGLEATTVPATKMPVLKTSMYCVRDQLNCAWNRYSSIDVL